MIDLLKNIIHFLGEMLSWIVGFFEWCVVKVFVLIFDAVVALLSLIPVPEWISGIAGNIGGIDDGVLFFIAPLQFSTGMTWVVAAYVLRFLIRRLPVVG